MKPETKEKMKSLCQKTLDKVKKPNKKVIAAICAAVLIVGAVTLNLVFFGGGEPDAGAEKTGLAVDLTSLSDPEDAEERSSAVASDDVDDYFATVSLGRKQARDEAMDVLLSVSQSADATEDAKADAIEDMNRIALDIEREAQIETLVVSRGFNKCVAVVNGDTASVIIDSEPLTPGQTAQVSEIVYEAAGIVPANLKIIERNSG